MKKILYFILLNLALVTLLQSQSTNIKINKKINYQKIDGFGAFGGKDWLEAGYDAQWLDTVLRDLGVTILRHEIDQSFEMVNDNSDPNVTDYSKFNLNGVYDIDETKAGGCINPDCSPVNGVVYATPSGSSNSGCNGQQNINKWFSLIKAIHERSIELGDTIKIIGTVWSPPAWMKYNNCRVGTDGNWNRFIASDFQSPDTDPTGSWSIPANGVPNSNARPLDRKEEYAEFLTTYCKIMKSVTGVDMYAIGIGNEPAFAQTFQSCVWSPAQMAKGIQSVGRRFKKEGVNTKIMWSEDIGDIQRYNKYKNEVIDNDSIREFGHITATHAYNSNGTKASSNSATTWNSMYQISNKRGNRPFWMTETSGYGIGIRGGSKLNDAMYIALKYGKINAWVWWTLSETQGFEQEYALIERTGNNNYILGKRYYVSKQYYKYIRPGAISIGCDPLQNDGSVDLESNVLALGFQHNQKNTLTLVISNRDTVNAKSINFIYEDGTNPPSYYEVYRTSETENAAFVGTIAGNATNFSLVPRSVNTFYGRNSFPVEIPITGIQVFDEKYNFALKKANQALKIKASVLPLTATNQGYSLSIVSGPGTIDTNGNLTATGVGRIRIRATSNENATITGDAIITVGVSLSLSSVGDPEITEPEKNVQINSQIVSFGTSNISWKAYPGSAVTLSPSSTSVLVTSKPDGNGIITIVGTSIADTTVKASLLITISGQLLSIQSFDDIQFSDINSGELIENKQIPTGEYILVKLYTPSEASIESSKWTISPATSATIDETGYINVTENGVYTVTGTISGVNTVVKSFVFTVGPTSVKNGISQSQDFTISPNPAKKHFNIEILSSDSKINILEIQDIYGKTQWRESISLKRGNNNLVIEIPNLNDGLYFVKIGGRTKRVVISN